MTKTYPSLYSKDSAGNIREWFCEVERDKFRMVAGVHGGAMVRSSDTTAKAKNVGRANETSPEQQAILEVEALYKKKLKTKYFDTIEGAQGEAKYFQPMLAKSFFDCEKSVTYPVGVNTKLNGVRGLSQKHGIFSRKNEKYISIPHIEESVRVLHEKDLSLTLDGELYNYNLRTKLNELIKLVRKTKDVTPEELEKSREMVEYHVYDILCDKTRHWGYEDRQKYLNELIQDIPYLKAVPLWKCNTFAMVNHYYEQAIGDNEEGLIIRILNQPYEQKRSKYLLKLKPEDTAEFKIVDLEYGVGNWSCGIKTFWCEYLDGRRFKATLKGTMEHAAEIAANPRDYIGQMATIMYNGLTGKGEGLPNYARLDYNNWKRAD